MQDNNKAARLWFLQRLSAFIILAVLSVHLHFVHYADLGSPILFAGVALRLKSVILLLVDAMLLFFGLFHGLNGLRAVLLDYTFMHKYERKISELLLVVGLIFFIWGVRGLWAFVMR
jgi:succinate dehydrogenase hydrophobic anchor subunit